MLELFYRHDLENEEIIEDVEKFFHNLKIDYNEVNATIIVELEQGELLKDVSGFIDRYGYKLRLKDISTGTKAVLCIANSDAIIATKEVGAHHVDYILNNCKTGKVLIDNVSITPIAFKDNNNKIKHLNVIFSNVERYVNYLMYEYPGEVDIEDFGGGNITYV